MPIDVQQNLLSSLSEEMGSKNGKNGAEQGFVSLKMNY